MMLTIREPPAEGKKQFGLRETPVSGGSQGPGLSKQTTVLFGRMGGYSCSLGPGRVECRLLASLWGSNAETPVVRSQASPVAAGLGRVGAEH